LRRPFATTASARISQIGRFGHVEEVAPTALLLASLAGANHVAQTPPPNGGDVLL
jgi:3-oxoacyl-[acyl-carrier protein] reductase